MADTPAIVKLEHVTKTYETPGGEGLTVLDDVSLTVAGGESLAVVGPSGSGKSTLLNIIGTLDRPTAGKVLLAEEDLAGMDDDALAGLRSRQIGFVFQLHHLLPQCTILENMLLPTLAAREEDRRGAEARARALLDRVGLSERLGYRPGQLSGGERQRAAVVRALINAPRLLLADEPTGSLDHTAADTLSDLLVELNRDEGVTLIAVTHSMDLARRMGRVLLLRDGVLRADRDAR